MLFRWLRSLNLYVFQNISINQNVWSIFHTDAPTCNISMNHAMIVIYTDESPYIPEVPRCWDNKVKFRDRYNMQSDIGNHLYRRYPIYPWGATRVLVQCDPHNMQSDRIQWRWWNTVASSNHQASSREETEASGEKGVYCAPHSYAPIIDPLAADCNRSLICLGKCGMDASDLQKLANNLVQYSARPLFLNTVQAPRENEIWKANVVTTEKR